MRLRNLLSGTVPIFIPTFFLLAYIFVPMWAARNPHVHGISAILPVHRHAPEEDYARAIVAAMQPLQQYVSHSLVLIDPNKPVTVVTWTQQKWVSTYKKGKTPRTIWVTVAPHLQSFCRNYVKSNGDDLRQLTLRLEQRLGLPPNYGNDTFVELQIDPGRIEDVSKLFRPCDDPSTSGHTCSPLVPPDNADDREKVREYWLLNQYYGSYAAPQKGGRESKQYPWTSLGYTFDWAPKQEGNDDFERWGESEFVVASETPATFVSATNSAAYCAP
jgi:hypothetical protein